MIEEVAFIVSDSGNGGEDVDRLLRQKLKLCRLLSESSSEAVRDDCDVENRDAKRHSDENGSNWVSGKTVQ